MTLQIMSVNFIHLIIIFKNGHVDFKLCKKYNRTGIFSETKVLKAEYKKNKNNHTRSGKA